MALLFFVVICCNGCKVSTVSYTVGFVFPSNKIYVFKIVNGNQCLGRRIKTSVSSYSGHCYILFYSLSQATAFIQHYLGLEI